MTTQTATHTATHSASLTASKSVLIPCILAAFIGIAMITIAGHVQAGALHDAAHDVRHATGFPCH